MDFLPQSTHQWLIQWRESPVRVRWTISIALALGCITLALAIFWPRTEPRELLFDGVEFSRSEMTAMEAAFGKAQLNEASVVNGRFEVPTRAKHLYLKALYDQQALPATFFTYAQRSLATDHPFTSPRQREAAAKLAKEQEIALILRKISGIEEASVQYEDSDLGGFPRRRLRQATAAVRARGDRILEPTIVHAIRATLMNTLGITSAEAVTVLDLNAGVAHSGLPLNTQPATTEPRHVGPGMNFPRVALDLRAIPASLSHAPQPQATRPHLRNLPTAETRAQAALSTSPSPASGKMPAASLATTKIARTGTTTRRNDHSSNTAFKSSALASGASLEEPHVPAPPAKTTTTDDDLWADSTQWAPPTLVRWVRDNALTLLGAIAASYGLSRLCGILRSTRMEGRRAKTFLRSTSRSATEHATHDASSERTRPTKTAARPPLPLQQLHEQIQGDPSGAAATLRQWLGNAA